MIPLKCSLKGSLNNIYIQQSQARANMFILFPL